MTTNLTNIKPIHALYIDAYLENYNLSLIALVRINSQKHLQIICNNNHM